MQAEAAVVVKVLQFNFLEKIVSPSITRRAFLFYLFSSFGTGGGGGGGEGTGGFGGAGGFATQTFSPFLVHGCPFLNSGDGGGGGIVFSTRAFGGNGGAGGGGGGLI